MIGTSRGRTSSSSSRGRLVEHFVRQCGECTGRPRLMRVGHYRARCLECGAIYMRNFHGKLVATGEKGATGGHSKGQGDGVPHGDRPPDACGVGRRSRGSRASRVPPKPSVPVDRTRLSAERAEVAAPVRGESATDRPSHTRGDTKKRKQRKRKQPKPKRKSKSKRKQRRRQEDRPARDVPGTDESGPRKAAGGEAITEPSKKRGVSSDDSIRKKFDRVKYLIE